MLTAPLIIAFIIIYTLYAAAQNRRLTRISQQLSILLEMKEYEIDQEDNKNYPPEM